jgi:hypothetical protein
MRLAGSPTYTGSNCNQANIYYGSTTLSPGVAGPGSLTLTFLTQHQVTTTTTTTTTTPFWGTPNPPASPSKSASGSTMNISWSASPGGNVAFYRIYRDGQDYAHRYDTCEVGDTGTGGCDNNNGTFTYADQNTGGTSHTYWISAVYGTGAGAPYSATMGESSEVAVP